MGRKAEDWLDDLMEHHTKLLKDGDLETATVIMFAILEIQKAREVRTWEPIGPQHKDRRWIVAIHKDTPNSQAIVCWIDNPSDLSRPWRASSGDHHAEESFTHAFFRPDPPYGEKDAKHEAR